MKSSPDAKTNVSLIEGSRVQVLLSVIVPFCDDPKLPHLRSRLAGLCRTLATLKGIEAIVVEGRATGDRRSAGSGHWECSSIQHFEYPNETEEFSISAARNHGAQRATGVALAFCDVDLRVSEDFWGRLLQFCSAFGIGQFKKRYFCVPCLYLSERGTADFISAPIETRVMEFVLRWLNGDTSSVQLMAPCSSFIVVDRLHYLSVGGHSLEFSGHGFEDFELHHRLAAEADAFARPADYYRDYEDWATFHYQGFRALFSLVGRGALYANLMAVHLWHQRPSNHSFYQAKPENRRRLVDAMKAFDSKPVHPFPLVSQEAQGRNFLFLGLAHSNSANTLRDVFPLLGTPLYVNECSLLDDAGVFDAHAFEHRLRTNGIDRILFPNPYRTAARQSVYEWCRDHTFPYLVFERGALPNSWFFDSQGFNADSTSYSRSYWDRALTPAERADVQDYIDWSLSGHETLEQQGTRRGAPALAAQLGLTGKKVLFVPLQRPSDTVTVHMAGVAVNASVFLSFIDQCAEELRREDWVVICKQHPYERCAPRLQCAICVDPSTNVLDLVDLADGIALMNSSVGLYAMMAGKPCYVFSKAFYSFDDINLQIESLDVAGVCARVRQGMAVDMESVYRFLHYLTKVFYSFGRAAYYTWEQNDETLRKAATSIDFYEIRIPGLPYRVYKEDKRGTIPLRSPLYERFRSFPDFGVA